MTKVFSNGTDVSGRVQVPFDAFKKVFDARMTIDGRTAPLGAPVLEAGAKSILLDVTLPKSLSGPVEHEIEVKTVIAKEHRQYPVHLADPTLNPRITFNCTDVADVTDVSSELFFNSKRPFDQDLEIDQDRESEAGSRRITVRCDTPDADAWVFPNSGVLFTWQLSARTEGAVEGLAGPPDR